ncbi:MAG TPA: hypothetical protein P5526_21885 [Anaerolineae bacterium]|nr:hypothetical protein [Anaerolineae bacterium]MCB0223802.1 hypothetical protein [Anaerolineae bacterium]MCB9103507.1 hypothetical protein [Anaerolineales bacterium]HRV94826.1 hypothetical protein [Anaerolineae bacterium]
MAMPKGFRSRRLRNDLLALILDLSLLGRRGRDNAKSPKPQWVRGFWGRLVALNIEQATQVEIG